jgi:hypothetical protein
MNSLLASDRHLAALKAAIANRQKTSSVSLETALVKEDMPSRVQAASINAAHLLDLRIADQRLAARPVPSTAGSSLNANAVHLQRPIDRKRLVKNNLVATRPKSTAQAAGRTPTPSLPAGTTLPSSDHTLPLNTKTMLTTQKENVAEPSMRPESTAQNGPTTPITTPAPIPLQAAVAVVEVAVVTRTPTTQAPDPNNQPCPPPHPSAEPS